jgi:ferrous iron transport protein B
MTSIHVLSEETRRAGWLKCYIPETPPEPPILEAGSIHFNLDYGREIEAEITRLVSLINQHPILRKQYSPRWLAVKLLEDERDIVARVGQVEGGPALIAQAVNSAARISQQYGDEADIALADARYGFVNRLASQVLDTSQVDQYTLTDRIDSVVTHRLLGLPIFLTLMYVVFKLVVDASTPFLDWVDFVVSGPITHWVSALLSLAGAPAWLYGLIVDGIIPGVGSMLVFVPGLFVLYFFLTLLEDSGYMARAAFVMDRVMGFLGLHGKSFIPLILGFGCNVPAIYATRTLENRRDRIVTSLLVPLMSCSARLPVYVIFCLAFFPRHTEVLIVSMYILGLVLAALVGWILTRVLRGRDEAAFVLELPPYRLPTWQGLLFHTWEKTKEFLQKAGTVILAVSVLVWLLMSLPWGVQNQRDSYFGQVSAAIAPVFEPAGFGTWQASGSLLSGFIAKELVVGAMSQIYVGDSEEANVTVESTTFGQDVQEIGIRFGQAILDSGKVLVSLLPGVNLVEQEDSQEDTRLTTALQQAFSPLSVIAFTVFVLLYTPCVATLSALKAEFGWRWAAVSALYQLTLAWLVAVFIYQAGMIILN